MKFHRHVGIDYAGGKTPLDEVDGIEVYWSEGGAEPSRKQRPPDAAGRIPGWTRSSLAHWIQDLVDDNKSFVLGIDHAFSFPLPYLDAFGLANWGDFLDDFCEHWPTRGDNATVKALRQGNQRTGDPAWFRLAERWTRTAKSVFRFNVKGQVAYSTHAGIPWLKWLRDAAGDRLQFWPFDGWKKGGKQVVAEVYPALFKSRFPLPNVTEHQQDAYAVAKWLRQMDEAGALDFFLDPPLSCAEREVAEREGWILGVV